MYVLFLSLFCRFVASIVHTALTFSTLRRFYFCSILCVFIRMYMLCDVQVYIFTYMYIQAHPHIYIITGNTLQIQEPWHGPVIYIDTCKNTYILDQTFPHATTTHAPAQSLHVPRHISKQIHTYIHTNAITTGPVARPRLHRSFSLRRTL